MRVPAATATGYEIRVETTTGRSGPDAESRAELFRRTLPAGVTSWTPSIEQCLERGQLYVWTVRALLPGGGSEWSTPVRFQVNIAPSDQEFRQALQVIDAYTAHRQSAGRSGAPPSSAALAARGDDFAVSADGSATAPGAYEAGFQLNRSVDIVGAGIESSYLYPPAAVDTRSVLSPHFLRLTQLAVLSPEPQLDAIRANIGASLFMNRVSVRVGSPPADGIFEDRFEAP